LGAAGIAKKDQVSSVVKNWKRFTSETHWSTI